MINFNASLLAARVFNTPLMITQGRMDAILRVLAPHWGVTIAVPEPMAVVDMATPKRYRADDDYADGIGVIPIYGTLVHRAIGIDAICEGLTSYNDIRGWFAEALNNERIKVVVLDIDTFGGEVGGVFSLSDDIYQARGIKPVYAMINESAYSAGYAIASAADAVFIPQTGGTGSIGVIMVHVDQSQADQKAGLAYSYIYSGSRKKDLNAHEPLPKEVRSNAQLIVDNMREIFINTVARNRGLSVRAVKDTEAGVYYGQQAVNIGLADEVMSFSELLQNLSK